MKKYTIIIITAIALVITSCSDDYLDVNTDPNNPTVSTPALTLATGQNFTARWMHGDRRVSHLGSMITYQWGESGGFSWYNDEFLYLVNSTFYDAIFDVAYTDAMKQYEILVESDPEVYGAYVGIGRIMKAYTFQILVDFYGDIPYSQALQRSEGPTPAYDNAEDIYADLLVQLTQAIEEINAAEENDLSELPFEDDVMFEGDLLRWKQFANTIKLRILTRGRNHFGNQSVSDELDVIANEGSGFITSDVEINPGYSNADFKQNPFWEDFGADTNGSPTLSGDATCATDYMLQKLQDLGDPRINLIFEEPDGGHLGVPQGVTVDPNDFGAEQVSNFGPGILRSASQDAIILTAAESYFNQAELALEGVWAADPETLYNQGVRSSFATLEAADGSADNYLATNIDGVTWSASTDKLGTIMVQKWIANTGFTGEQSWFDHSRTGYPDDLPVSQEAPNLRRPVRLAYPASEVSGNQTNIRPQKNVFSEKLFWAN